jgi:peptide/nickel transport system permease protein
VPPFWLCLIAIHLFAVRWRLLPPDAQIPPGSTSWLQKMQHLLLPILLVAIFLVAEWARYVRAGMREVLDADFIRAARARGLRRARVLWLHALPNAIMPFLTVVSLSIPYLVGGELMVEAVFGWPGIGQLEYNAIRAQDANLAMAALLVIATAALLASVAVDLVHAALDPRVRQAVLK